MKGISLDLSAYLEEKRSQVDAALARCLPSAARVGKVAEAMAYSLFAGGKRVRPILCLAGAEAVGGEDDQVMFCACALEMIHTYSLIHDDLPAMDDDDLRRGKPSAHKVFGEGVAILAGDGLLTQAMVLLTDPTHGTGLDPQRVLGAAHLIMEAAGIEGMVGGQAADLWGEGREPDLAVVELIHAQKTGALIAASVASGALLGGGDEEQINILKRYGRRLGLAFQIADDLLNLGGDVGEMGKAVGTDEARCKMTYPAAAGKRTAQDTGWRLAAEAQGLCARLGDRALPLSLLARYIMERTH